MTKLWLIGYDCPGCTSHTPVVVCQCDREPTEAEAKEAVYKVTYGRAVYIESIRETSESELRGKQYILKVVEK